MKIIEKSSKNRGFNQIKIKSRYLVTVATINCRGKGACGVNLTNEFQGKHVKLTLGNMSLSNT